MASSPIAIATNNGDIGGGEVMLFNLARAMRSLGYPVTIVGPARPSEVVDAAADEGFDVVTLPASSRHEYMAQLRVWDKHQRQGILWCNGLVPSFATSGHKNRVVHLHQIPQGKLRWLVKPALKNALMTLLPSDFATETVKNSTVFANWTQPVNMPLEKSQIGDPLKIGFIGRPSILKGTDTLAHAVEKLNQRNPNSVELVIAGSSKFIDEAEQTELSETLQRISANARTLSWVEPAELFQQIDMLVVPSKVPESFGLVAAEAMSARVPLLVSDAGALPEVVGKDYPWIFEKNNVDSLAQKILEVATLLKQNPDEAAETVSAAYWRWHENYSVEAGKSRAGILLQNLPLSPR